MEFRFQEPETDVEAVVHKVTARLEGQKVWRYVKSNMGTRWGTYSTVESTTPITLHDTPGEAFDRAREDLCREVKAQVLDAAARKVRGGHAP